MENQYYSPYCTKCCAIVPSASQLYPTLPLKVTLLKLGTCGVQVSIITFNASCTAYSVFFDSVRCQPPSAKLTTCWYPRFQFLANCLARNFLCWQIPSIRRSPRSTNILNRCLLSKTRTERAIFLTAIPLIPACVAPSNTLSTSYIFFNVPQPIW